MATLLTGVGYIGATLIRRLAERGGRAMPIVGLDNFFSTTREQVAAALPQGTLLIEGDVADPDTVARAFDAVDEAHAREAIGNPRAFDAIGNPRACDAIGNPPTLDAIGNAPTLDAIGEPRTFDTLGDDRLVVYHLAAQPSAAIALQDPQTTERSNLIGARVVLEAARERNARVVFGGSFRVYGDDLAGQTVDEQTPYGRVGDLSHLSKIYVEQLARMMGVPFISVRLGVTYGRSPIMKTTRAFMTVPNLFCQRAAHGEVLQVLEDRPVAFIHVRDAADALIASADGLGGHPHASWEVVNAATEVATIGQVARIVQRLARERGLPVRIEGAAASEASFAVRSRLDTDGFAANRQLGESLGDVLDYFLGER